jgi:hypothetical protein
MQLLQTGPEERDREDVCKEGRENPLFLQKKMPEKHAEAEKKASQI